ncbi:hypothetical protein [Paenarthrobacter sp. NCHU4564]|uniref:hypothetical protein n=1 Tax=Paenarthrobacter sp. NCHU4564 TaxID=3451353 RepID=UPI003F961FEA
MLNEDTNGAPRLAEARYREANESHPEHVHVRFDIERAPGMHLLDKATQLLHSSDYLVGGVIDGLATEHLRNATGATASIGEDGYAVFITATIPPGPAATAAPSVDTAARTAPVALTPEQAAVQPAIEEALTQALPASRVQHAGVLAEQVAKELPTRDQVTAAYHQPTLDEVIDKYAEQYDPDGRFLMPKSLRTVALSYPHSATAAPAAAAPAAAASGPAQRPVISAGYGR